MSVAFLGVYFLKEKRCLLCLLIDLRIWSGGKGGVQTVRRSWPVRRCRRRITAEGGGMVLARGGKEVRTSRRHPSDGRSTRGLAGRRRRWWSMTVASPRPNLTPTPLIPFILLTRTNPNPHHPNTSQNNLIKVNGQNYREKVTGRVRIVASLRGEGREGGGMVTQFMAVW